MKTIKRIIRPLILLSISVFILSCPVFAGKIKLSLNLNKAYKFKIEVVQENEMVQNMMGQDMNITSTSTIVYTLEVLEITEKDNYLMKVLIDRMASLTESDMGVAEIDSDNLKEDDNSPQVLMIKGYVGSSFIIRVDKTGQVLEVIGTDVLIKKITDLMNSFDDPALAGNMEALTKTYGADAQKNNMGNILNYMPNKKIKKGSSWKQLSNGHESLPVKTESVLKVKEIDDSSVVLESTGKISTSEQGKISQMNEMDIEYQFSGNQEGEISIDRNTGLIIESKMRSYFEGELTVSSSQIPEPMTMPINVKGTTIIKNIVLNK